MERKDRERAEANLAARPRGGFSSKLITVIESRFIRGEGTPEDLNREVIQYWDFEGNLLAEVDPVAIREKRAGG